MHYMVKKMITKYTVDNEHIYFYEDDEVICTLPNNEDNIKLAKLYNDQVFINDDLKKSNQESNFYNEYCKKEAIYSLICFIVLVITNILKLPLVSLLSFYLTGLNVFAFMISKGKLRRSDHRLAYLRTIKKNIEDKINEINNNKSENKVTNLQLTFSNDQIVEDHKNWLTNYGDSHDYSSDLEMIKNSKVFIKKL